jgi:hypothetical protein
MSHQLVSLSPDIARLRNEGYEVKIRGSHLLISHVPYVDLDKTIQYGTLISVLNFAGEKVAPPNTHIAHFIGTHPCNKDGSTMKQIQHGDGQQLAEGLVANHSFSHKPTAAIPTITRR